MRKETFNMTPREMAKLRVIDQTIAKNITVREAAELLNLSERQVLRLKKSTANELLFSLQEIRIGLFPKKALLENKPGHLFG